MLKKLKESKGFTIIEVMIVLAIAGLIILIVLLAVPALQRNGRNTAIKSDASAIAGGVGEFASNNDGAIPSAADSSASGGTVAIYNGNANASRVDVKIQASTSYQDIQGAGGPYTPRPGELIVSFGARCGTASNSGQQFSTVTAQRSTAIIYAIETAANNQARCLDS